MRFRLAIIVLSVSWFFTCWPARAGFYVNTVSPGNVPGQVA